MIQAVNVSKGFDGKLALDGANVGVPAGSVYGLVGPNGAGKSTLIRLLTGLYRPDSGEIRVDSQPVFDNPALKGRMLCVYDDIFHFLHASTKDFKRLFASMYPNFDAQRYGKLREAFAQVDEDVPMRSLSKGMLKQSALWLALSCKPDVLLLDEPVDGLDPVMRRQVWSLLAGDVAERGTTVLLSSHNLRELEDICDYVGVLNQGKMLVERSLSDMQGNITKVQVLHAEGEAGLPVGLEVLHREDVGRMGTYIVRGNAEQVAREVGALSPQFFEVLPLTLEEIFIYELEGVDYAVQNILL